MKFLLDVNVLVALGVLQHEFHLRVANWVESLRRTGQPELLTCPITELGFVRVLANTPIYGLPLQQAQFHLIHTKRADDVKFTFIPDDHDAARLPSWVKTSRQVTDGHLFELAQAHGAGLATLDERIPRAFLIPKT